jgi:hypothetical protein
MPSVTIANTASEILPRNRLRKSWIIQNEDSSINVYIKKERAETPTVSSTDHDHRIAPGGSISANQLVDGIELVQDRITIIAASGTPRVSYIETEDIAR